MRGLICDVNFCAKLRHWSHQRQRIIIMKFTAIDSNLHGTSKYV